MALGGGGWDGLRISKDMFDEYDLADKRRKATFMLNGDIYPGADNHPKP
jgi:hypothetical protein